MDSTTFSQSRHLRVIESHFSGVVKISLYSKISCKSIRLLSPVIAIHSIPNGSNFDFHSINFSLHNALTGATVLNKLSIKLN